MTVAILLATYNSEKFLKTQLDSILKQTYQDWRLYLRDDGSKDSTLLLINEYINNDSRISLVNDSYTSLGAARSFMKLLENVESDYYMFADHDDYWLPTKVEESIEKLKKIEDKFPEKPIIVHSDLFVVDQNLEIKESSFWKSSGIKPNVLKNKNLIQVFNFVTGCTMIFNKKVKDIVFPFPETIPMHDWWLTIQVLKNEGIVEELEKPLIYYRQHGMNEVGARNVNGKYFIDKLLNIKKTVDVQLQHVGFLKDIRGLNIIQYYWYKLYYTFLRKI